MIILDDHDDIAPLGSYLNNLMIFKGASQATQSILQRLVRRLTRFTVKLSLDQTHEKLNQVMKDLKLQYKQV